MPKLPLPLGFAFVFSALLCWPVPCASAADVRALYDKTCAPCHGKDGRAQTPAARKLGVKDLSLSKLSDEAIAEQIREGKQKSQEKETKMTPFKDKLTAKEIDSLVKVVKEFRK